MVLNEGALLDCHGAGQVLGLSACTVRRLARSRRLPHVRIGGPRAPFRFDPAALARWLDAHSVSADMDAAAS